MRATDNNKLILKAVQQYNGVSSKEIHTLLEPEVSYSTVKRMLNNLLGENYLTKQGQGKATKYFLSKVYNVVFQISIDEYFQREIDEREINSRFNFDLIENILPSVSLFNKSERERFTTTQAEFLNKLKDLSTFEYEKELERLAIDLSWKSAQIEGNTYSLLETEYLLKEKKTAAGKTKDEAVMLLNHKDTLDFIFSEKDYFETLTIAKIEEIHSLLVKELPIDRNIRKRRVGISGTNYVPLDNEFQIREALEKCCNLINRKENAFEKAFLTLILLSYIQPFNDGNKRTARILSNAILLQNKFCPMSFRTVDAIDYKKATLIFYEQNNVSCIKNIFMEQFEFAVKTYF